MARTCQAEMWDWRLILKLWGGGRSEARLPAGRGPVQTRKPALYGAAEETARRENPGEASGAKKARKREEPSGSSPLP